MCAHHEDTEDISEEEGDEQDTAETVIKKLREKLKACEKEKQEHLTLRQRDKADFINARKEDAKRNEEMARLMAASIILELLPVLDSFDLACAEKETGSEMPENWRQGIIRIRTQLLHILGAHGLKTVDPTGEKFDPAVHVSVSSRPVKEKEKEGIILRVTQKGYALDDAHIRPAQVEVGEYGGSE